MAIAPTPSSLPAAVALVAALACFAWVAARRLGLGRAGAALAAAGCAGSGAAILAAFAGAAGSAQSLASLAPAGFDLVSCGALILAAAAIARMRARADAPAERAVDLSRAIGFAMLVAAVAIVLARRGLPDRAFELAIPESGGWRVPWIAAPVAALALAGIASATGKLRARGAIALVSVAAALIALGAPGPPGLGGTAMIVAAFVATIGLALLAGDALESAPSGARLAAGLALAALVALAATQPLGAGATRGGDPDDELIAFSVRPARHVQDATLVEGRVHGDVGADQLLLVIEPQDEDERTARVPARVRPIELRDSTGVWREFSSGPVDLDLLPPGLWRFDVELMRRAPDGSMSAIGRRTAAVARIRHGTAWLESTFALMAAFVALFGLPGTRWRWLAAVLAAACSVFALRS